MDIPSPRQIGARKQQDPKSGECLDVSIDVHDGLAASAPQRGLAQWLGPWGSSLAVHGLLVILLLAIGVPLMRRGGTHTIIGAMQDANDSAATTTFESLPTEESDPATKAPVYGSQGISGVADSPMELVDVELIELDASSKKVSLQDSRPGTQDETDQPQQSQAVTSVESAVDHVTGQIQGKLEQGDVLVVWLVDTSLSLKDDRNRVAKRLSTFFESPRRSQQDHELFNAVAVFGHAFKQAVAPTDASGPVLRSIQKAAIDLSGSENVFAAVQKSIAKYRRRWKAQMMIVVWTDESGDDIDELEKTIALANEAAVNVSVVGPAASLGSEDALHDFTDPQTGTTRPLPISRGPDSALTERLKLRYWFPDNRRDPFGLGAGEYPEWHGNDQLVGLTSNFSPWALTRLCEQTGGHYTMLHDMGPFDGEKLAAYLPSYEDRKSYQRQFSRTLPRAVQRAVRQTYAVPILLPPLNFAGNKSRRVWQQVTRAQEATEKALVHLSEDRNVEAGLEYAYNQESSLRWKAWYDLTRGRLLGTSVRLEEYRLVLEEITRRGLPIPGRARFRATPELRANKTYAHRANEARRLLQRCCEDHAGTPWALLAQRELQQEFGMTIREVSSLVLDDSGMDSSNGISSRYGTR